MSGPVIRVSQPGRNVLYVVLAEPLEIGRECAGLLVDDDRVSRRHVELSPGEGEVMVRDLGSSNGTTIDGRAVTGPTPLALGERLTIGDTTIEIVDSPTKPTGGPTSRPRLHTSIELVADAFVREGGALPDDEGRTRTIVFSDIEGSTEMAVRLGDMEWYRLLEAHNELVRARLRHHRGTEVKSQGDGFMLTFSSARGAVAFMIDTQRELETGELAPTGLRIRIGAHTGEALETADGDLFGRAVIMAARVGAAAEGGEILVSSLVREIVESWGEVRFGAERMVELKGLGGRHRLHPVEWSEESSGDG